MTTLPQTTLSNTFTLLISMPAEMLSLPKPQKSSYGHHNPAWKTLSTLNCIRARHVRFALSSSVPLTTPSHYLANTSSDTSASRSGYAQDAETIQAVQFADTPWSKSIQPNPALTFHLSGRRYASSPRSACTTSRCRSGRAYRFCGSGSPTASLQLSSSLIMLSSLHLYSQRSPMAHALVEMVIPY